MHIKWDKKNTAQLKVNSFHSQREKDAFGTCPVFILKPAPNYTVCVSAQNIKHYSNTQKENPFVRSPHAHDAEVETDDGAAAQMGLWHWEWPQSVKAICSLSGLEGKSLHHQNHDWNVNVRAHYLHFRMRLQGHLVLNIICINNPHCCPGMTRMRLSHRKSFLQNVS